MLESAPRIDRSKSVTLDHSVASEEPAALQPNVSSKFNETAPRETDETSERYAERTETERKRERARDTVDGREALRS